MRRWNELFTNVISWVRDHHLHWPGSACRWAASNGIPALTAEWERMLTDSPGRPASCSAEGGAVWRRGVRPGDQHWREQRNVLQDSGVRRGAERSLSYLKLRPCMTARGPEGASWVGKQFLKSAHWTKESAVFAISVLRMRQSQNHCQAWKLKQVQRNDSLINNRIFISSSESMPVMCLVFRVHLSHWVSHHVSSDKLKQ